MLSRGYEPTVLMNNFLCIICWVRNETCSPHSISVHPLQGTLCNGQEPRGDYQGDRVHAQSHESTPNQFMDGLHHTHELGKGGSYQRATGFSSAQAGMCSVHP